MSSLVLALLSASALASAPLSPQTNATAGTNPVVSLALTNAAVMTGTNSTAGTNDPVDAEYDQLLTDDYAVQDLVAGWIHGSQVSGTNTVSARDLARKAQEQFAMIKKRYIGFLTAHPTNADGQLAYGDFLYKTGEEDGAVEHWELARTLNPKLAGAWNGLANYWGENGQIKKAFEYYSNAIALDPKESVFYHNFGDTLYLYRKDAKEYFHIDEPEIFRRALALLEQSCKLDPTNFPLAQDYAESFYGVKPVPIETALGAWTNAYRIAENDFERQGIYIHFARLSLMAGRYAIARASLGGVTDPYYQKLKDRIGLNIEEAEHPKTNAPPAGTLINTARAAATNSPPDK